MTRLVAKAYFFVPPRWLFFPGAMGPERFDGALFVTLYGPERVEDLGMIFSFTSSSQVEASWTAGDETSDEVPALSAQP